ncbi:MAG: InlB B-repeat-containing protein [Bacteroidaceae bacterium]|nr:InlB B-repeat-containing protein [Bacteroidaceae bacterium]
MKRYIISIIAMAFGLLNSFAQTISVDDVAIKAGETKVVSINLNNSQTNIVSFQMDLSLPDGITLNKAGCGLSGRFTDSDQELTIGKQPNGDYRLTSTSLALKPISDTSGEIFKLSLSAASDAKGGTASLKNIILATSNSQKLTVANVAFKVNVSYSLTYKVDGEVYKTKTIVYGSSITPETAPTKEGYTFSGWSGLPATMPNHDVVVTGTFFKKYTLTYKVDGEVYKIVSVAYSTTIIPEPAPIKRGYTFSGWNGLPTTMPDHDVTVTGTFIVNEYTLTYMVDGVVYKTQSVAYGEVITPEPAPSKEGYTFSGWIEIPYTMPAHDVTVTGKFIVNKYTLTYKVDGAIYKTYSVAYGAAITPEPFPTKEGFTFSGWNEVPAIMPAHDMIVTGFFSINQYMLAYVIDGEEWKSYRVDYNTAISPESAPTKKGMTFSGWGDVPERMPAHDVTLTGSYRWSQETFDDVIYQVTDTLAGYASVIGREGANEEITILPIVKIGGDVYTVNNIAKDAISKTLTIYTAVGKLLLWLWNNGYENILETGTGRRLSAPELMLVSKTASSLTMSFSNDYPQFAETVIVSGMAMKKKERRYDIALNGLEPDMLYEEIATFTLSLEEEIYTKSYSLKTEPLTLTTQQPKVISVGNVIVAAKSNLDDEETNVGFEWRRTDWTDDFASNTGTAYLYNGTMEGYIRNMYTEKLWKYRPYYEANSGNRYYGEWVGIDPTNTSYFEPTVHTYAQINVQGNRAEVRGYAMRGTDKITVQGFMYWKNPSSYSLRKKAASIPADAVTVLAKGNVMTATLEDLEYETEYCCVAFATTEDDDTFFGEMQTFRTGEMDPDGIKSIEHSPLTIDHSEDAWYSLDGRKLGRKPAKAGIYINGGRKVVVK